MVRKMKTKRLKLDTVTINNCNISVTPEVPEEEEDHHHPEQDEELPSSQRRQETIRRWLVAKRKQEMSTRVFTQKEEECSTSISAPTPREMMNSDLAPTSREGELVTIETNSVLIHFPREELECNHISREGQAMTTRDQDKRINNIRDKLKVFEYTPRDETRQGEETTNPTFIPKKMKEMNTSKVEEMTRQVEETTNSTLNCKEMK